MNIGIAEKNRKTVVGILNRLLADEYVLYTKTRNYHWNVKGPHFSELHKFFESQYEEFDAIIDEKAERACSLGGDSLGTLKEFLSHARLKESPGNYPEAIIRQLREDLETSVDTYQDMGTSDYLTGLMERHEKMAWMLRSFLE